MYRHKVLVTRPLAFTEGLCQGIMALGGVPELFPTIQILPMPNQKNLIQVIHTIEPSHYLIFVSRSSVNAVLPVMKQIKSKVYPLVWCAVGPGTAHALDACGISPILSPCRPPYESESLLALQPLEAMAITGKRVLIFRANKGRELLMDTLRARGAFVQTVEVYQRCIPQVDMIERYAMWQQNPIDSIVCTSIEGMQNLISLVKRVVGHWPTAVDWLTSIPIVVVSNRMLEAARLLGFQKPVLAFSAEDAAIIQAIKEIQENRDGGLLF